MSYEDLEVSGFNFNQLLISSIDTLKATALEKCIEVDKILIEIYQNIMGFKSEFSSIQSNLNRLLEAAEKNKALVENFQAEKEADPLY